VGLHLGLQLVSHLVLLLGLLLVLQSGLLLGLLLELQLVLQLGLPLELFKRKGFYDLTLTLNQCYNLSRANPCP